MVRIEELLPETINDQKFEQLLALLQQLSSSVNRDHVLNAVKALNQTKVLVAYNEDEQLVGTATMAYLHCLTGLRVHIEDVVVDEKHRGKGIAQLLLKEAIRCAQELNATSIDLTSRPEREAANRLYRKLGFVQRDTNVYRYQPK